MNKKFFFIISLFAFSLQAMTPNQCLIDGFDKADINKICMAIKDGADPNLVIDATTGYPAIVYGIFLSVLGVPNTQVVRALLDAGASDNVVVTIEGNTYSLDQFAAHCITMIRQKIDYCEQATQKLQEENCSEEDRALLLQVLPQWYHQLAYAIEISNMFSK